VGLSEGIVFSSAGILFYGLAFAYEAAYFRAFGAPLHLIHVSLDSVFVIGATVSSAAFFLYTVINAMALFWPKHRTLQVKIFRSAFLLFLVTWPGFVFGFKYIDYYIILVVLLAVVAFEIAWPIFVFRDKPLLADRIEADEVAEAPTFSRTIFGRFQVAFGPFAYALMMVVYFSFSLANSTGREEATRRKEFMFIEQDQSWLVVRAYPDRLIAVAFDSKTKTVEPRVMVRSIGETGISLVLKSVGPLNLDRISLSPKP
jgi:hypothetical protein